MLIKDFSFEGDVLDIVKAFEGRRHLFVLESSLFNQSRGRYSFMGFDPFDVIEGKHGDIYSKLREKFRLYASDSQSTLTPLDSGMVGFLSYDYGLLQENISRRPKNELPIPNYFFGCYDAIITVDHLQKKLYVTSSGLPETNPSLKRIKAQKRLNDIEKQLKTILEKDTAEKYFPARVTLDLRKEIRKSPATLCR